MTLVLVVQGRLVVIAEEALPHCAHRHDRRAQLVADARVGVGDGCLRFGRVLSLGWAAFGSKSSPSLELSIECDQL